MVIRAASGANECRSLLAAVPALSCPVFAWPISLLEEHMALGAGDEGPHHTSILAHSLTLQASTLQYGAVRQDAQGCAKVQHANYN